MQIIKLIVWHLTLMLYCMNIWGDGFSNDPEKFFVSVPKSKGLLLLCFCSTFCSDYFFPSFPTPQYHIVLLLLSSLIVPRSWEFLPSLPPPFLRWDPMLCCCCVRCWQRWLALSQQRVFTVTVGRKHQSHRAGHTTTTTACVFPTRHSRNTAGFQPLCLLVLPPHWSTVFCLVAHFSSSEYPVLSSFLKWNIYISHELLSCFGCATFSLDNRYVSKYSWADFVDFFNASWKLARMIRQAMFRQCLCLWVCLWKRDGWDKI